jgi:putative NADH-flavin reductase
MHKLLTVVGGTGTQGLSLINAALKDGTFRIRAITRNPDSDKSKSLAAKGVEVVKADINDESSLIAAFNVGYRPILLDFSDSCLHRDLMPSMALLISSSLLLLMALQEQSTSKSIKESTSQKRPQKHQH